MGGLGQSNESGNRTDEEQVDPRESIVRRCIGCRGLATGVGVGESVSVRVIDVLTDERGWSAVLGSEYDPDDGWWSIGHFAWDPGDPELMWAHIDEGYWHIPRLEQRYVFTSEE